MGETKSKQILKFDLKIYDPTEPDKRKGTQIKIKDGNINSLKEILVKYFG